MPVVIKLRVEDFGDFIFRFFIYNDWRRWRLNMVRNGVQSTWFKHRNMKDWVYSMHTTQKMECPE
jgi:hypothetical protein